VSGREGRSPFRAIGLFLFLYLGTRVASLSVLPIFLDEAVHLQWAERLFAEGRILRPVGSGRLLAVVTYGLALPFGDRLFAARLIATCIGGLTLIFTMLLARKLFGGWASGIAGALYVLSPFALVYDRLALSDGFLCAFVTGLMLAVASLAERPEAWPPRFAVAALITLAVASKVSAPIFFLGLPLGVLALGKERGPAFRSLAMAVALGLLGALPMLWFFAQHSGEIAAQHLVDAGAIGATLPTTLGAMREWVLSYFTLPALLVAVMSAALLRDARALWLGGSIALPFALFALFSQPWSARYVLPSLPPFLLLIAGGIERVGSKAGTSRGLVTVGLVGFSLLASLTFDRDLLFDPSTAPFPPDDRLQLVTGWPSGYGVGELAARLAKEAESGEITVFVDNGGTRTFPTGLAVLLGGRRGIHLVDADLFAPAAQASMVQLAKSVRVFAVIGERSGGGEFKASIESLTTRVDRLKVYERPGGEWAATLFQLF
jgi:hypothetical protein